VPAALEHVDDARNHPPVIDAVRARLVLQQMPLDLNPSRIRQLEQNPS